MIISKQQECVKAKNRKRGKVAREKEKRKKKEKKTLYTVKTFVNARQERMK